MPQLAFEIGLIWIVRVSMHFYKKNAESLGDKDKKNHWMIEMLINFATSQMLYPLKLVSTMQAAGGKGWNCCLQALFRIFFIRKDFLN